LLYFLVCYIDWKSNNQMPFTIFYIVPVALIAFQKGSTKVILISSSVLPTLLWLFVYIQANNITYTIFNGFLRLCVFLVISFAIQFMKKQQSQLKEQNIELLRINEEKNKILGIAAHDIRNGIGSILSFSQLLNENQNLKSNYKRESKFIEIICKSSENLINLLNNILDISKIESGTITLSPVIQDYKAFVSERVRLIEYIAHNKEIEIETDFKTNRPNIQFDSIYLQEAIDNLLSNAIKYSHPKSKIKISIYDKNDFIITEVTDSGVGIPADEISKLFNVFSKTSSKPTLNEASTGLGLAIAKKIIDLHQGTIGVNSVATL
jgi:signal transduction histidine kinase